MYGKRGHKHEECRAREVKVGQQLVDNLEAEARGDEEVRLSGSRLDPAISLQCCGFECPHNRRADSHDVSTTLAGLLHG